MISRSVVFRGRRYFVAETEAMASAIVGVISPIIEWATTIAAAPTIMSTVFTVRTIAFSPEAPLFAPAFNMAPVAMAFVPRPMTSTSSPKASLSRLMITLPIPPPWPSITAIDLLSLLGIGRTVQKKPRAAPRFLLEALPSWLIHFIHNIVRFVKSFMDKPETPQFDSGTLTPESIATLALKKGLF